MNDTRNRLVGVRVTRKANGKWWAGTVVSVESMTFTVHWDVDIDSLSYKIADSDGILVFDIRATGQKFNAGCDECSTNFFLGFRWQCCNCSNYDLCNECYIAEKHDLSHTFMRFNVPSEDYYDHSDAERVAKRSVSKKVVINGLFRGAKVSRGKDWFYGDQDDGNEGTVKEVETVEKVGCWINVEWANGNTNWYRWNLNGIIDILIKEAATSDVYVTHLPDIGTYINMIVNDSNAGVTQDSFEDEIVSDVSEESNVEDIGLLDESDGLPLTSSSAEQALTDEIRKICSMSVCIQDEDIMETADKITLHTSNTVMELTNPLSRDVDCSFLRKFCKYQQLNATPATTPLPLSSLTQLNIDTGEGRTQTGALLKLKKDIEDALCDESKRQNFANNFVKHQQLVLCLHADLKVKFTALHFATCHNVKNIDEFMEFVEPSDITTPTGGCIGYPIAFAAAMGHYKLVKKYAKRSHPTFDMWMKAIHAAAANGHTDIVKWLDTESKVKLESIRNTDGRMKSKPKSLLNWEDAAGNTALHIATNAGHVGVVKLIIERGENRFFNHKNKAGKNALSLALKANNTDILNLLKSPEKLTIHQAASCGRLDLVHYLINKSVKAELIDIDGNTMLHAAAIANEHVTVKQLIGQYETLANIRNRKGDLALHVATRQGNVETVEVILAETEGCLFVNNNDQMTPLHLAANGQHVAILRVMVKHMEQQSQTSILEAREKRDRTAFHIVCNTEANGGRTNDCLELLIHALQNSVNESRYKSVLNARDKYGNTALIYCAKQNHLEGFTTLVSKSASMTILNNCRKNCLHVAAEYGHHNIVQCIIENTLERDKLLELISNDGTPLRLAVEGGHIECISLLKNAKCRKITSSQYDAPLIVVAAECENPMVITHVLNVFGNKLKEQDINAVDWFGESALMACILRRNVEGVRRLLEREADVSAQSYSGSVLMYALKMRNSEIISMIVRQINLLGYRAADIFNRIEMYTESRTVLGEAIADENIDGIQELSAAKGIQYNQKVGKGQLPPLFIAVKSMNSGVLKAFLSAFCKGKENSWSDKSAEVDEQNGVKKSDLLDNLVEVVHEQLHVELTALMYCVLLGNIAGIGLLLKAGACIKKHNSDGWNVLHISVMTSVVYPLESKIQRQVIQSIKDKCDNDMYTKLGNNKKIFGLRRFEEAKFNPIQFAAACGSVDLLDQFLRNYDITEVSKPDYLKLIVPSSLSDSQNSTGDTKDECSCLALIDKYCTDNESVEMLNIHALQVLVVHLSYARSTFFYLLLMLHVIFMTCFTAYVVPTCYFNSSSMPGNSGNWSTDEIRTSSDHAQMGWFLIWPVLILFYEFYYFARVIRRPKRNKDEANVSTYNTYAQQISIVSHLSSLVFVSLVLTWFVMYVMENHRKAYTSYVPIVAVVIVYGWMQTIEYVKGSKLIHAFSVMIKIIVVKDLFRILCIYSFVLLGFAFAIHVFIVNELGWNQASLSITIYQTFGLMVGMGSWSSLTDGDVAEFLNTDNALVVRLLIGLYLVISTIILMNVLIAMMTKTYEDVINIKDTLWCLESLGFIIMISKNRLLRFIFKTILRGKIEYNVNKAEDRKHDERLKEDTTPLSQEIQEMKKTQISILESLKHINDKLRKPPSLNKLRNVVQTIMYSNRAVKAGLITKHDAKPATT